MNYLLDADFLQQINEQQYKAFYAKIIALNINEDYVDEVQGKITGGSINIDGTSAVRRTCSLTMVAAGVNINDYYWSLKTKFKLEIGISNLLSNEYDPTFGKYPKIVWFPMGTYIFTSFNTSLSVNGLTISLSGKDKMCMLNGELGGQLFASIDFGTEETLSYQLRKIEPTADNSDTLMSYNYYEKVDSNDTSIEQCVFELDNNSGNWFLLNGSYIYDNTNPKTYTGNHYTKYKKIITPHQLFVSADTTQTCIANTYFYKKQDQPDYYLLNTTTSWKSEGNNFQLKDLYEVERNYSIKKIPLEKIIRESVHAYAKEPFHNIIIQDVDKYALEQVLWRGDEPLVVLRQKSTGHFTNVRFLKDFLVANEEGFQWDSLVEESIATTGSIIRNNSGTFIISSEEDYQSASNSEKKQFYTAAKIEYGQDIGYRITDLVYNGDLITSIGESLTSVLDKIKNMLGDFEYFYDTDGRFIFRRKPIYVNTSWSHFITTDDERYVTYANNLSKYSYSFEGNNLITAIQNTPVLTNLKNDFVVWGKRKGINGEDIPIHARYAIDKKPTYYKALNGQMYATSIEAAKEQNKELFSNIDNLLNQVKSLEQLQELKQFLNNFSPTVSQELINANLETPIYNKSTHTWSPGWWDIQDWAEYYTALTGKTLEELGTMQFFASNDETGCTDFNGRKVWLLGYKNGNWNTQHNSSTYNKDKVTTKHYYLSTYENGQLNTYPDPSGFTKEIHEPYSGCNERHTYFFFLDKFEKENEKFYFYNPNFLSGAENEQLLLDFIYNINIVDWREIIYQMALDYFAGHGCSEEQPLYISDENNPGSFIEMIYPDDFLAEVAARNPSLYPTGYTGYEQYYTDMQGFWRQLYYPNFPHEYKYTPGEYTEEVVRNEITSFYTKKRVWVDQTQEDVSEYFGEEETNFKWWNKNVRYNPEVLNFWIDFLDQGDELSQFSISQVGDRQKVINDDKVSAIIFKEIPDLILYDTRPSEDISQTPSKEMLDSQTGYTWIYIPKGFNKYLSISYRNISAKNKIDDLIYQYAYCIENISLTAIPIYNLEPNSLIQVFDEKSNINGEYIVTKISFSLNYNGTMQIQANKSPKSQEVNDTLHYFTVNYIDGQSGLLITSELVAEGVMPTQIEGYLYWTLSQQQPTSADTCIDFNSYGVVTNDVAFYGWNNLACTVEYRSGVDNSLISSEQVDYGNIVNNAPGNYYWTNSRIPPEEESECIDLEEYITENKIFYGWTDLISYQEIPTQINITLNSSTGLVQQYYFEQSNPYTVKIDWGDGSVSKDFPDTAISCEHIYNLYDSYSVKFYVENVDNVYWKPGQNISSNDTEVFRSFTGIDDRNSNMRNQTIQSISFGPGLRLENQRSFMHCITLGQLDFSNVDNGINIASETFYNCSNVSFAELTIPESINQIQSQAFENCRFNSLICAAKILEANAFLNCTALSTIWLRNNCKQLSIEQNTSPWIGCNNECILYCEADQKIATWGEDYNVYSFENNNTIKNRLITVWTQTTPPFNSPFESLNVRLNYSWSFEVSENDYNNQKILPLTLELINDTTMQGEKYVYRNRIIDWSQNINTAQIQDYSDETDNPEEPEEGE